MPSSTPTPSQASSVGASRYWVDDTAFLPSLVGMLYAKWHGPNGSSPEQTSACEQPYPKLECKDETRSSIATFQASSFSLSGDLCYVQAYD
eukprot:1155448-Pelagomonas_calceolata.AAC.1